MFFNNYYKSIPEEGTLPENISGHQQQTKRLKSTLTNEDDDDK